MLVISGHQLSDYSSQMEDAFRLRHQVFVEEMGWEAIRREDGRETDQFDNTSALHMLDYRDGELIGYQRLLPTTEPHLLDTIYPELCEDALPRSPHIWEWTRFAVRKDMRQSGRKLSPAGNRLLSAIVEWGLDNDVNAIVIEMNPIWMLRLVQLRFRVRPLGFAKEFDGVDTLAVVAEFDSRTLARLRELRGDFSRILDQDVALAG